MNGENKFVNMWLWGHLFPQIPFLWNNQYYFDGAQFSNVPRRRLTICEKNNCWSKKRKKKYAHLLIKFLS